MKRNCYFLILAAFMAATSVSAKNPDQLRVYINPGHGSWTSDDRPRKTIREVNGVLTIVNPNTDNSNATPDTTAFFESNTNLVKCFAMLDKLESYGLTIDRTKNQSNANAYKVGAARDPSNNLVMSRTKNGPYPTNTSTSTVCNRSLTEIAVEAQTNNFDMFISVHSNALNNDDGQTTNYPLFLYRGTDASDRSPGSKAMAQAGWPYVYAMGRSDFSNTGTHIRGDVDFYGSEYYSSSTGASGYLGALRHTVPGYLAEGYFHSYQPARLRAMNFDVDRLEGYQYARGIADYFGLQKESTGDIYGVVRDGQVKFVHDLYTPRASSKDVYKPINGATVILRRQGKEIARKVTDNNYNGAFVFADLETGAYTVTVMHPDYLTLTADVSVAAASIAMPDIMMTPGIGEDPGLPPAPVVDATPDYPDMLADESVSLPDNWIMQKEYGNQTIDALAGMNVRRIVGRDRYHYIFAYDDDYAPAIVIVDATDGRIVRQVSTEGASGSVMPISDIALTADGYLVALNGAIQTFGSDPAVIAYIWDKDDDGFAVGNPREFFSINHAGNWEVGAAGKSMCYSGTATKGRMVFVAKSTASQSNRLEIVDIDGLNVTYIHNKFNDLGTAYGDSSTGDMQISVSPFGNNRIMVSSENRLPFELQLSAASAGVPTIIANMPSNLVSGFAFRPSYLICSGKVLMVVPDDKPLGFSMFDISSGLANASAVSLTESTQQRRAPWTHVAPGVPAVNAYVDVTRDDGGTLSSYTLNVCRVHDDAEITTYSSTECTTSVEAADILEAPCVIEVFDLLGRPIADDCNRGPVIRRDAAGTTVVAPR